MRRKAAPFLGLLQPIIIYLLPDSSKVNRLAIVFQLNLGPKSNRALNLQRQTRFKVYLWQRVVQDRAKSQGTILLFFLHGKMVPSEVNRENCFNIVP